MALVVTKEVENFRTFMKENLNKIEYLIIRLDDEYEYEGNKPYKEEFQKMFSTLGETKVKSNGRRFTIETKLNDFQRSEVKIGTSSIKWNFYQKRV